MSDEVICKVCGVPYEKHVMVYHEDMTVDYYLCVPCDVYIKEKIHGVFNKEWDERD